MTDGQFEQGRPARAPCPPSLFQAVTLAGNSRRAAHPPSQITELASMLGIDRHTIETL